MMFQPRHFALLLPLLFTLSCGGSEEAKTEPAEQSGTATQSVDTPPVPSGASLLSGEFATERRRINQLPSDPFFVEFNYPGSKVFDVMLVLGSRQVYLETTDSFETVDAYYAKKFTSPDGTVNGIPGRYFEAQEDGSFWRTKFDRRDGGGCIIMIAY